MVFFAPFDPKTKFKELEIDNIKNRKIFFDKEKELEIKKEKKIGGVDPSYTWPISYRDGYGAVYGKFNL